MSSISVRGVTREFVVGPRLRRRRTLAVDDVSFEIARGEVVALVGESGSGKTTIGRMIVGLMEPTSGTIAVDDQELRSPTRSNGSRHDVQMVFQNTQNAFNPRRRVLDILSDPLRIHRVVPRSQYRERAAELFAQVGLEATMLDRFPHEFSGGQRQRVSIARALALSPRFLVADEPVSALDVSVQAQILNLLARLRSEEQMGMLFVSHDMRAVSFLSDRIAVLYYGRLVEIGDRDDVLARPAHPYTRALIDAVPTVGGGRERLRRVASLGEATRPPEEGCNFRDRCPLWRALGSPDVCAVERPALREVDGRQAACHFAESAVPELVGGLAGSKETT